MEETLIRIDAFCDAVPRRHATAVDDGPLRLFRRRDGGFPLYARPVPGAVVTADDVARMRARQRATGVPEAFEWVHAASPTMHAAAVSAGLSVQVCPVLVLPGAPSGGALPVGFRVEVLDPADPDLTGALHAVSTVGAAAFGAPPPPPPDDAAVATARADLIAGASVRVLVSGPDGPAAAGQVQRAGDVAELVGIGTVAAYRGRGLGAAVTALLARVARAAGVDVVFLAAGSADATRVYERVGFRRVGECGIAAPG